MAALVRQDALSYIIISPRQIHKGEMKMSEAVITAVISAVATGAITLIGSIIANSKTQAIMETRLEELTREVREHNGFARRMPVVEEQIKVINHRIADLEHEEK